MALRREFKPDKLGSSWLSKLYLTRQQRRTILKWVVYLILLVLVSLVQDVILCKFRLWGAATDLVPCLLLLICITEGAEGGGVFALLGALYYLYSGTAPGPYVVALIPVIGIPLSILRQAYLRKGFLTALICLIPAMVLYELGVFAFGMFLERTFAWRLMGFILSALLSMLAVPVMYPVCRLIHKIGGQLWNE